MVTVGFSAAVNAQLGISTVQETITVTGQSPIVDTKDTGHEADVHQRAAAEHPVGARPVGHPPADGRHRHGPREHRRQHVGPAVQLRVARRQPDQQQVVARRRRHHRHGGDRRVAELLRLRRVRGDDDQHRRRRRDAADRRRRHQPRDQERHRPVHGLVALLRHQRPASSRRTSPTRSARRARRRATRFRTSRTTASRSAARSRRASAWIWGSFGKQTRRRRRPRLLPADARRARRSRQRGVALAASIDDVNDCLNTDETLLQTTNLKAEVQLFKGNKLTLFNNFAKKVRNARGASDLNPIETTTPQARGAERRFGKQLVDDRAERRPTSSAISGCSATGCCSTCSTRTSATTSSSTSTIRRSRPCSRRSSSSTGLNGRSGTQSVEHPSGQQRERRTRTTSCPARWAATTRSSSAATGATTTASDDQRRRRRAPRASRPRRELRRRTTDCATIGCRLPGGPDARRARPSTT